MATIIAKELMLLSDTATYANKIFVIITRNAPMRSDLKIFTLLIKTPPKKMPNIEAANAITFTIAPISVSVKPISM